MLQSTTSEYEKPRARDDVRTCSDIGPSWIEAANGEATPVGSTSGTRGRAYATATARIRNQICSSANGSAMSSSIDAAMQAAAKRRAFGARARRSIVQPMSGAHDQAKNVVRFVTVPVS